MMAPSDWQWLLSEYQQLWAEFGWQANYSLESFKVTEVNTRTKALSSKKLSLEEVRAELGDCRRCALSDHRTQIVFGAGNPKASLMFVGEGPGADEDQQGEPFVGKEGQLLTKIVEAMGEQRSSIYIANIVKCRPPNNRAPENEEAAECFPFLKKQIESVAPRFIVALGAVAAAALLQKTVPISEVRGKFQSLPFAPHIQVMPTFHPAYLLQNPEAKKLVWEDMKLVMRKLK